MSAKVKEAAQEAASAQQSLESTSQRTRRNHFHVFFNWRDATGETGMEYLGAFTSTADINEALNNVVGSLTVTEVKVIFGHERKAQRQTKVVFR